MRLKYFIITLFIFFICPCLFANENKQIQGLSAFDNIPKRDYFFVFSYAYTYSENAVNFESIVSFAIRTSDYPVTRLHEDKKTFWSWMLFFSKSILVDLFLSSLSSIYHHDIFGHMELNRMYGGENHALLFRMPPPYTVSAPGLYMSKYPESYDRYMLVSAGGLESNTVFAHNINLRWVKTGVIHYADFWNYIMNKLFVLGYIAYTTEDKINGYLYHLNDVATWITQLNYKYGYNRPENYKFKKSTLTLWSLFYYIDPFPVFALIAYFKALIYNEKHMKLPFINFGKGIKFLPGFRLSLTPFGPELYIDLFFNIGDDLYLNVYPRIGDSTFRSFGGLGIKVYGIKILKGKIELGFTLEFFSQPEETENIHGYERIPEQTHDPSILDGYSSLNSAISYSKETKFGFAIYADANFMVTQTLLLYLRIGYKMKGYIMGFTLDESFIFRVGMGFEM